MKKRWHDVAILLLGTWLLVSAFFLPRTVGDEDLFTNSLLVGLFLQVSAIAAIMRPNAWKEWIFVILGSWLIASSFLFGKEESFNGLFSSSVFGLPENGVVVGVLVLIGAGIGLFKRKSIREMDKPTAANV